MSWDYFFFFEVIYFLMYVSVLVDCMSVHNMYAWCLRRLEGGITSPELVLMNCCEPLWVPRVKFRSSERQQVLLPPEPSFQPVGFISYMSLYCIPLPRSMMRTILLCQTLPPSIDWHLKLWAVFLCQVALSDIFSWYESCCNTVPMLKTTGESSLWTCPSSVALHTIALSA